MSQVGDAAEHDRRVRWVAGIIAGLVGLAPFGVLTTVFWGFWQGEAEFNAPGWAMLLIGLAAGLTVGGYVATTDD